MAIEQWLVDGHKTIDIERITRVKANLVGGSLAILAHDEPQARVEVSSTSVRNLKVAVDGDTLIIDHPQLSFGDVAESAKTLWGRPRAEVSLLVPQHCDIDVKAASAEVLVVGVHGEISLNTAAGEQFVDGTVGDLSLSTVDAEISVRDHHGVVSTRTVAGDVTVAGRVATFAGNTVTGTTVLDITGGLPDRISNRSATGTSTIRIPTDVTPNYRVSTVTAHAHLEGEDDQPQPGRTYASPEREYEKRLTEVHLQTVAGRITVVRAGEGADDANATGAASSGAQDASASDPEAGAASSVVTTRKVFRRIVKDNFDDRIDERVASASDQLGVEPHTAGPAAERPAGASSADGDATDSEATDSEATESDSTESDSTDSGRAGNDPASSDPTGGDAAKSDSVSTDPAANDRASNDSGDDDTNAQNENGSHS